jgi:ribosome-interacting GTPase 1
LEDANEVEEFLSRARGERIIVLNKSDLFDSTETRKMEATFRSRKIKGVVVSALTKNGLEDLKEKMFSVMGVIRVYMKEPGKILKGEPLVLKPGATIKDVAESIRKGFSLTVSETRVTGPSGKFPNQRVGMRHVVKDRDVVEFHTR